MNSYAIIVQAFGDDIIINRMECDYHDFIDCSTESVVFVLSPLTIEEMKSKYFTSQGKYVPC